MAGAESDIEIDADNGLNAILFAFFVELDSAIEIAGIGERE